MPRKRTEPTPLPHNWRHGLERLASELKARGEMDGNAEVAHWVGAAIAAWLESEDPSATIDGFLGVKRSRGRPRQEKLDPRVVRAFKLHINGKSWNWIAGELGYAYGRDAQYAVDSNRDRLGKLTLKALRAV